MASLIIDGLKQNKTARCEHPRIQKYFKEVCLTSVVESAGALSTAGESCIYADQTEYRNPRSCCISRFDILKHV